ncbi:MAG: CHAT domain-containing protein, partial [Planctomycetes bacterium]|nr:CHAT domain-containing protein [Planctomycetota bacterium]
QEIGEGTNLTKALFSIGDAYFEKGDLDNAVKHFGQALELAQRLNIRETEWRALRGMGRVHRARGNLTDAHDAFQKAIAVVEDMRAGIKVEEFRNGFLENKLDLYEDMVILLLDLGRVEDAFTYSERSRAKSFIDLLGNQRISLQNAADQKLYERQQALKNKIRGVEESVGQADGAARDKLHADLVKLRAEYRDLLIEIKAANPQLSSFVSVDVIKLPDLYALLSPDAALLEYLVARKEIVIWVVRKGDVQVFRIATDTDALRRKVMDYRQLIQNLSDLETKPKEFYDLLIKPVEPQLKGVKYLGIVPHGILHYLSFASLHDGTNYLVDDYSLFHSPSASVMQYTFRERKGPKNTRVLAIGNPDLGTATYDLPFAEKEVKSITWNFPQIDVLTREKATESWVVGNIGKYGIIHIASHGEFDPVSPLFSALKLRKDAGADGNLEVNEVTGLQTDADLVTLSACQTGLGKIESADEVIGLNRAFIYAGTRAILSSLWRVSDVSTAIMVKHFYRNYQEANKADSLRKAQLLVKRYYPHPSYWAGFVLTGDYR